MRMYLNSAKTDSPVTKSDTIIPFSLLYCFKTRVCIKLVRMNYVSFNCDGKSMTYKIFSPFLTVTMLKSSQ